MVLSFNTIGFDNINLDEDNINDDNTTNIVLVTLFPCRIDLK